MKRRSLNCLDQDHLMADEPGRSAARPSALAPAAGRLPRELVAWVSEVAALLGRQQGARPPLGRRLS